MNLLDQIKEVAQGLFGNGPALVVWGTILLVIFVITCLKVAYEAYKESKKGFSFSSVFEIAKPIVPAYLSITLIPVLTVAVFTIVGLLFEAIVEGKDFDNGNDDLVAEQLFIEEVYNIDIIQARKSGLGGSTEAFLLTKEKDLILLPYKLAEEINEYLFVFALSTYVLWLVIIQIFAPLAGAGFIFKELKEYSTSWTKNYISSNIFLAAIVLANGISLGVYNIYAISGEYNFLVHIIFMIMLRAYLYNKAFSISSKII